ncbi:hypothetical protein KIH39_02855 [Telmatocola sphagniphila]|uniref:Uncharacterized protein n=1 Tax=Telmatocola sphagniphila TaxID=1123043 RepID=A0A8E6EYZ4_9BACT|nr:hypothetical protein [Telmatocola sphagniphila]QVL32876.1 hypothetical protein KIH39_02855 [Telmatocola sphagniphila]
MPIVFACPFCGEGYKLKDEYAGKKATCRRQSCRKVFTVPSSSQPVGTAASSAGSQAPVDAEALALSALADEPEVQRAMSVISMICKNCDHHWDVEVNKQGKNVPCPECRTINKVPIPKEAAKQDWRVGNQGLPSGAKQNFEKLEGVAAAGLGGYVSGTSIVAAGAAPKIEYEPLTLKQKAFRVSLVVVPLLLVAGAVFFFFRTKAATNTEKLLKDSLAEVTGEGGSTLPEYHAAVLMATGEYRVRAASTESTLESGFQTLQAARKKLSEMERQPIDRGMLMIDLSKIFTALAGEKSQIEANTRKSWEQMQKEVRQTLDEAAGLTKEFRIYMIHALAPLWINAGKGTNFAKIVKEASPPEESHDLMAYVGLEAIYLKKPDAASDILGMVDVSRASPFATALIKLTDQPADSGFNLVPAPPASPNPISRDDSRLAYSIEAILRGRGDVAKSIATRAGGTPEAIFRTTLLVSCFSEGPDSVAMIETANRYYQSQLRASPLSPWLIFLLIDQSQTLGKEDLAQQVIKSLSDETVTGWAKFIFVRNKMNLEPSAKIDETQADDIAKPDLAKIAASYARYWIVRRNTKKGDNSYFKSADNWAKITARPFGLLGAVLGAQDKTIKN